MIALYTRVSSQEQAQSGYSLEEQSDRLQKYASAMGWTPTKVYTDPGFTGANTERPALQQLIRDVRTGTVERVVVWKLDRLSRSQRDTLMLIEDVFLANRCDFVSMNENFDTSTPFGRAMIGILAVFAQLEREQIRERMIMGKDARAKSGKYHGSRTPIGYDYENGELVVNNSEAAQVREIFALHNSGMGSYAIAQKLNDEGLGSKYGPWHEQVIRKLLTSQTYIGMIRHRDQWLQGNHEPIIDRETFDRAQRITEQRKIDNELHHRRFGVNAAYLSGFVVCGKCGMKYSHKHTTSGGKKFEYYGCSSRFRRTALKTEPCDNKIWRGPELEGLIFDEIRKLRLESAVMVKDDHLDTLSQRRVELQKQIERLIDLYAQGSVSRGTLEVKIEGINEQLTKVDHQIESIEAERRDRLTRSDAQALAQDLSGILDRGDYHEIRALISALIENIIVNGDDITIFWRFS